MHAMRIFSAQYYSGFSDLCGSNILFTLSHKGVIFEKKNEKERRVSIFTTILSEIFLIIRRI